ncbi:MAG: histidinol-phosphate transaminase [Nitrososphaerales archaeon]
MMSIPHAVSIPALHTKITASQIYPVLTKPGHLDIGRLVKEGFLTASPRTHGGRHYVKGGDDITDFSTNVNPLGASGSVYQAIRRNIGLISHYPDPESRRFKKAVSDYLHLPDEEQAVVVGNGANELIHLFADAFVGKGEKVVIPVPTFFEYEFACDKNSASIAYAELDDHLRLNTESILAAMDKETKVVFICNPNNPTGLLASRNDIEKILDQAYNNGTLVLLDECFMEFVEEPERNSFVNAVKEYDNLVVLRTLTKAFGLAGLRAGYCIAGRKIARLMNKVKVPWSVNALAEVAAVAALQDVKHLRKTRALVKREKPYLQREIAKQGFEVLNSDTNFFLVRLDKQQQGMDSVSLKSDLLKRKILIRDCSTFTGMGTDCVRISTQRRSENKLLVDALKEESGKKTKKKKEA